LRELDGQGGFQRAWLLADEVASSVTIRQSAQREFLAAPMTFLAMPIDLIGWTK
jgi:hypothetical protein